MYSLDKFDTENWAIAIGRVHDRTEFFLNPSTLWA